MKFPDKKGLICKMKRFLIFLFIISLGFSQTAQEIAQKVQSKIYSFHSLKANFTQIYHSATVSTPLKERGEVYLKKPNLMKWVYQDPEKKKFLYKQGTLWSYFPEDNQLIKNELKEKEQESEILTLLSGQKNILDNYSVQFNSFPTPNKKAYQIKLIPHQNQQYSCILLEINEQTWLIQKAIFLDWAGNKSEFHFDHIKLNLNFPPDTFELHIPSDTEIIEYKSK